MLRQRVSIEGYMIPIEQEDGYVLCIYSMTVDDAEPVRPSRGAPQR